jgi:hypothetical protein
MNNEILEALKTVIKGAEFYLNRKYGDRKRLDLNETFEKATMIRDIDTIKRILLSV